MHELYMIVKEIMKRNIVKIVPDKSVYDAAFLLREHKIGSVLVATDNDVLGIVTKRDIIGGSILAHKNPETTPVSEIMTTNIKTIHPLENIVKAAEIMEENKIKKLVVVNEDLIAGMITVTDISRATKEITKRVMDTCFQEETH